MCWEGQARWSMPLRFASGQSSTITGTYAGQYIMQVLNKKDYHHLCSYKSI